MCSLTEKLRSENKAFKVTKVKRVTNLAPVVWGKKSYCVGDMKPRQMNDKMVWPYERKKWGNSVEKCVRLVTVRSFGIWNWRGWACCGK
jgi:hypothetical protein